MSSAELATEPARTALEHTTPPIRTIHSWLVATLTPPHSTEPGLIQAFDKKDGEFTHLDEELLVQLAHIAAAAIERAHRYTHDTQP